MQYDVVAIGDVVTDAFIRLKEASVHCTVNRESCELCMRFGDKVPYDEAFVLPGVGNSPNAAVAAARLGLASALVTDVGADQHGDECVAALQKNGVATEFVRRHEGIPTNYHYVLWYESERTILVRHEAYPYVLPDIGEPRWIYLSSMGEGSAVFHTTLAEYLAAHPSVQLAFQPGTFQMRMGADVLNDMYQRTAVVLCNVEEAERMLALPAGTPIGTLLSGMRARGPRIAVITDGPRGAYAADATGSWFMPPYPDPKPPYERTGAGDAFSATVVAALQLGMTMPDALRWAPINAMSVVQQVGAQAGLLNRSEIEALLATAPADYAPRPLT